MRKKTGDRLWGFSIVNFEKNREGKELAGRCSEKKENKGRQKTLRKEKKDKENLYLRAGGGTTLCGGERGKTFR